MITVVRVDLTDVRALVGRSDEAREWRIVTHVNDCHPRTSAEAAEMILDRNRVEDILAARAGAEVDGLRVQLRSWTPEAGQRAEALGPDATPAQYVAAMGAPDAVTLTEDGRGVQDAWCNCADDAGCEVPPRADEAAWVRYERYTTRGRTAHGFVHRTCRRLLQAG